MEQIHLVLIPCVFAFGDTISQNREVANNLRKGFASQTKDLDFVCSLGTVSCLSLYLQGLEHAWDVNICPVNDQTVVLSSV